MNLDGFHPFITLFFFSACCKWGRHLYTATASSCCIPALYCHLSATRQTMSINVVNLQDNRALFQFFITLLKFSFDSPSYNQVLFQGSGAPACMARQSTTFPIAVIPGWIMSWFCTIPWPVDCLDLTASHFLLWWCNEPKAYAIILQCTKDWKCTRQTELEQSMVLSSSKLCRNADNYDINVIWYKQSQKVRCEIVTCNQYDN
jgi:hypothetical protein